MGGPRRYDAHWARASRSDSCGGALGRWPRRRGASEIQTCGQSIIGSKTRSQSPARHPPHPPQKQSSFHSVQPQHPSSWPLLRPSTPKPAGRHAEPHTEEASSRIVACKGLDQSPPLVVSRMRATARGAKVCAGLQAASPRLHATSVDHQATPMTRVHGVSLDRKETSHSWGLRNHVRQRLSSRCDCVGSGACGIRRKRTTVRMSAARDLSRALPSASQRKTRGAFFAGKFGISSAFLPGLPASTCAMLNQTVGKKRQRVRVMVLCT